MGRADPNARNIGKGKPCIYCNRLTERFEHSDEWQPLPDTAWYLYWDVCLYCRRRQYYPEVLTKTGRQVKCPGDPFFVKKTG